ncbi:hypothetical protein POLEWNIK_00470 [Brevundimonas phage vB_BpoS-Polewnik]|nr:hypothetical protein POLEWNIK_00470 [Brevundimonas phage vB_BpoS-Polewnik]
MIVNIVVNGDTEVIAKFKSMPAAVHAALLQKVHALSLKLEAYVKKNKLSGQVLNRKSGRLIRSIGSRVLDGDKSVFGIVFQSADVPYGGIHEYGGKTSAHVITPKKAKVLAFTKAGATVFARKVNHPGSKMPTRSYMRSSLREMSTEISLGMKEAIVKGAQQHMGGA